MAISRCYTTFSRRNRHAAQVSSSRAGSSNCRAASTSPPCNSARGGSTHVKRGIALGRPGRWRGPPAGAARRRPSSRDGSGHLAAELQVAFGAGAGQRGERFAATSAGDSQDQRATSACWPVSWMSKRSATLDLAVLYRGPPGTQRGAGWRPRSCRPSAAAPRACRRSGSRPTASCCSGSILPPPPAACAWPVRCARAPGSPPTARFISTGSTSTSSTQAASSASALKADERPSASTATASASQNSA